MLNRLLRRLRRFFQKSSTVNNEPINKVSLGVIILIDIFILVNVFIGLNDISQWPISPNQEYGCYLTWNSYQTSDSETKEYDVLRDAISFLQQNSVPSLQADYQRLNADHLGGVSETCLQYAQRYDAVNTPENQERVRQIAQLQTQIGELETANQTIREEYDSTLLEEIAGQPRDQSINTVEAAQARQELEANSRNIATLKEEQQVLQNQVVESAEGDRFLTLLNDTAALQTLENQYDRASFWHPSIEILWQGIFLVPLLVLAGAVHRYGERRGYGLIALISWHLVVIFCIPLVIKIFEFLQVGVLFEVLSNVISALLGGLLFLVSYLYILLIPLLGFGLIKFFQKIVFNPKVQAASRVQKSRCIRCAKKIHAHDTHCPHCGYDQYVECAHCHRPTYKFLSYCRDCGTAQQ